jgi:Flp pilus assembly secretin CpaC
VFNNQNKPQIFNESQANERQEIRSIGFRQKGLNKMRLIMKKFCYSGLLLTCLSISALTAPLTCQAETVFLKGTSYKSGIAIKDVAVGSSEIISSNLPIKRVAVTDPSVADIRILSETSAIVRGKKIGKTTILIWEGKETTVRPNRFDITVKRDISDLIASIKLIDPNINIDYVLFLPNEITAAQPTNSNGAYTTSFNATPETVGEPAPSVVVSNKPQGGGAGAGGGGAKAVERILLTGKVKGPDVIAKALSVASMYMGEDPGSMRILTRNGGLDVGNISGVLSPTMQSGGGAGESVMSDSSPFSSNITSNFSNGTIIANGSGSVVSYLEIDGKTQVAVKIRFYEISKNAGKQFSANGVGQLSVNGKKLPLGISGPKGTVAGQQLGVIGTPIPGTAGLLTRQLRYLLTGGGAPLGAGGNYALIPWLNLEIAIQALEQRGEAKVLAEPTIVVSSGEVGQFRVGGEVPIVNSNVNQITVSNNIQYQPYGISFNILPSITDKDSILMNVHAQTRDIDKANPFGAPGSPAFKTRKIDTQVEMDPGQALLIGGLINANSARNLDKVPWIGDIPILGALARSKDFSRGESELVVIISPEIIRPAHPSQINRPLALEGSGAEGEYDLLPSGLDGFTQRTSVPIAAPPFGSPVVSPVDLSKPTTVTDLDNIYR